ncbi:MAG TPA: D-2-hydroxyacid dehydrogenase [Gemmatimonadaceae bacterium]|nr:D-2-hydroxyacid dehydrogenase [Gemmatimonadaceae bacterium]
MAPRASRKLVVDLRSTADAFALPERVAQAILDATPSDWRTHIVSAFTDSFGDGAQAPSDEALREIVDAEAYVAFGMPRSLFLAAPHLRWVQTGTAGVATLLFDEMRNGDVVLTNAAGLYGPPIAEHVLAGVLHFLRALDVAAELRRDRRWDQSAFATPRAAVREVDECHVLVIGAGGLGSEIATRFKALGARTTGVRRRPELGAPAGFDAIHGPDAIDSLLPTADVLVLAAALTNDTRTVLDARRFALLGKDTIVCNVGRGPLLDEAALIAALQAGRLRGAVLDVFEKEPLAADSPLWQLERVVHTPHVSGVSPRRFWDRLQDLILDNWARYRAGRAMRNVVDKRAGY